jgi:hypothetical protein
MCVEDRAREAIEQKQSSVFARRRREKGKGSALRWQQEHASGSKIRIVAIQGGHIRRRENA